MHTRIAERLFFVLMFAGFAAACVAEPRVVNTTILGPFTGHDAPLHPDNEKPRRIDYYGTDLGWSYEHGGKVHFLFGDTHANERGEPIGATHDDAFGAIDLADWPDATRITPNNIPLLKLAQHPGSTQVSAMNPGQPMEGLKTPLGGFSNGAREFALFITGKPEACRADADCTNGMTCDADLGFIGARYDEPRGLTFGCTGAMPGCTADTMVDAGGKSIRDSGLCVDKTSTLWTNSDFGRVSAVGMKHLIGIRSTTDPERYSDIRQWPTSKYINAALRTVADFVPERGSGRARQDYRSASGAGGNQRVFIWGRPGFIGVNAKGQTLGLYFAYVDMPADADYSWDVRYYTGIDAQGVPRFSAHEKEAAPVDLDSTREGDQAQELHDVVQQMSIVWVEQLRKWVLFYGGGISKVPRPGLEPNCGLLEIFTRTECKNVVVGNGAVRMRTADDPWGPWSPPQDVLVGGDADRRPVEHQYASGGVLHHPACPDPGCQAPSPQLPKDDYGWLYGANIIEQWVTPAGAGVDVIWNASTWDPYRVILLKTRIDQR